MIIENVSLKNYNTFAIDVKARYFISVESIDELKEILKNPKYQNKFILSGGSNMLLTKDLDALVIHINLKGIDIIDESDSHVDLKIMAGENWHKTVLYCLKRDLGGIENLSLIPGNVGTAPIQNIGAYGVEIKDVFVSCQALNKKTLELTSFNKDECEFGYRESLFKNKAKDLYIITSTVLRLSKSGYHNIKTEYGAIRTELKNLGIENPTIQEVSRAVINIRKSKLPDPKKIGNSGSFFKNPVINKEQFLKLLKQFEDIPHYTISEDEIKIPAGWLIEKAGFKGKRFGDYGVHKKQALVLVNYDKADGRDIFNLANLIQSTIEIIFGITIEKEVNVI